LVLECIIVKPVAGLPGAARLTTVNFHAAAMRIARVSEAAKDVILLTKGNPLTFKLTTPGRSGQSAQDPGTCWPT
jgi:hypothetical protein